MSGVVQQVKRTGLKRYFVGFSTQTSQINGVRTLYDLDLINADLTNAFNTRVGERVMRPDYGCKLWDYVMEPLTPSLRDDIIQEAIRICSLDTRLVVQDVQVTQIGGGFTIAVTLLYMPWQVIQTFSTNFITNETIYFDSTGSLT